MADRSTLHVSKLDDFVEWAESQGFTREPGKGIWERLRLRHPKRRHPLIVYERIGSEGGGKLVHLTVMDRDHAVVRRYLRERRAGP